MNTQILIVDDHQIVREGVRGLLKAQRPGWSVIEAQDGNQALEMIRAHSPQIIVMDITMPGQSGLEIVSGLRKSGFRQPVLVFTMHESEQLEYETRLSGAQGYVLKSQAVESLVRAVDALMAGGTFYGKPSTSENPPDNANPTSMFFLSLSPATC
jgi:DNA-binding NarL/FixJ family response regulator